MYIVPNAANIGDNTVLIICQSVDCGVNIISTSFSSLNRPLFTPKDWMVVGGPHSSPHEVEVGEHHWGFQMGKLL